MKKKRRKGQKRSDIDTREERREKKTDKGRDGINGPEKLFVQIIHTISIQGE